MDYNNINQPYVHTYDEFKAAGLKVASSKSVSQKDLSVSEKATLNLIGIKVEKLARVEPSSNPFSMRKKSILIIQGLAILQSALASR